MDENILKIDPEKETIKIVDFVRNTFKDQNFTKAIIGLSGGIDSATSLHLAARALGPENIIAVHMPYFGEEDKDIRIIAKSAQIEDANLHTISIKDEVDAFIKTLRIDEQSENGKIRIGNIAARTRMITLFDYAKKENALVVGTENRSEELLSYFTRFGDEASDIEPLRHLFKTQVYALAEFLNVPKEVIDKSPSAGLWAGQTDEAEFGFSYKEADVVLKLYFDKNEKIEHIERNFKNARKIVDWVKKNEYKHHTPYQLV